MRFRFGALWLSTVLPNVIQMMYFTISVALHLSTAFRSRSAHEQRMISPPEGEIYAALQNVASETFVHRLVRDAENTAGICSLCSGAQEWVLIAATGRSGSTTTLNMLQRIPGFRLAGENGGVMPKLQELYVEAINDRRARVGAWSHGPLSQERILWSVQDFVKSIIGDSKDARTQRIGFKDISWGRDSFDFSLELVPCAQFVIQTRTDVLQQI